MHAVGRNLVKDGPFLLLGLIPGTQLFMLAWLAVHLVVMHRSPVYQAIHDRAAHSWVAAPEQTIQLRIAQGIAMRTCRNGGWRLLTLACAVNESLGP